ncbi:MAG: aspartate carbamoyltransferase catalytic subunit [Alphaproteobacteria bacterium]|nr:aspartate carbamoyltransferase catalytic subunit [Alphaproteobacteria bacterium]
MSHAASSSPLSWPRHLIQIEGMAADDIQLILDTADQYVSRNRAANKKHTLLGGRTLINLFFENSTRTRTSFELAGKRLAMDVINISASASSTSKGETLLDTAMTLNAMQADVIVLRHAQAGAVQLIAEKVTAQVINAGDGAHEHPTQALLDALTIKRWASSRARPGISCNEQSALAAGDPGIAKANRDDRVFQNLNITICGDIANSRVARSNIHLLKTMGAHVTVVAPPTLMPTGIANFGVNYTTNMVEGLKDADVVMMLRIQHERMAGRGIASVRDYFMGYGLSYEKLKHAKPDALVMHPGPMNRGVEIDADVADDISRSAILDQVEMGVAVRQAALELLLA